MFVRCMQECLHHIITALDNHPGEVDVQTKGLVLLGVLIQVGQHLLVCFVQPLRMWSVRWCG